MVSAGRETEIKLPVDDLEPIREALQLAGASMDHPMTRETNIVLDSADGRLRNSGSILRLRRYGSRCTVTYKGPASYEGTIKERIEHETEIADLDPLVEIFASLGFTQVARYEKDREEWMRDDVAIVLDHTPMGDFVEIEGAPEVLLSTAEALNLDPGKCVRGSYLTLWNEYRSSHPGMDLPADMVFTP
jgi:adenylate cyclase class 2